MSGYPSRLYLGQPSNTAASVYTCQAKQAIITEILVANNDGSARSLDVHIVASGGSASASNRIVPTLSVTANYMVALSLNTVLNQGDSIYLKSSSASTLTVCISGEVVTE